MGEFLGIVRNNSCQVYEQLNSSCSIPYFYRLLILGSPRTFPLPQTASSVGSPPYSSPEIIQGKPYKGPECDVWSLGVILYVMRTATMPFDNTNIAQFLVKVENGECVYFKRRSDNAMK